MLEIDDVLRTAHDAAFRMTDIELVQQLALRLGRVTVARLSGAADTNTVSRWSKGHSRANDARIDRLRQAAYLFNALRGLGFSEGSARQWFRSPHPALRDEEPISVIARGDFKLTLAALRQHGFVEQRIVDLTPGLFGRNARALQSGCRIEGSESIELLGKEMDDGGLGDPRVYQPRWAPADS